MNTVAYELFWDMSHVKGIAYDAMLEPFEGHEYIVGWKSTRLAQVPDTILFDADFKIIQRSDYPCNDVNWPLMSPRMIEVLRSVRDFPYRSIPVRLVDRRALGPQRFLPDGRLRPEVIDDRFVAVQLTEHIDVVDWEQSVYERCDIDTSRVVYFDRLIISTPPGGLPPLFRIPAKVSMLLVSAEARKALEAADIRGVTFEPLPDASHDNHAAVTTD